MDTRLLTLHQVASRLSCSDTKLKRMIRDGKFPKGLKVEGAARWPAADVDAYLHLLMRGLFSPSPAAAKPPRKPLAG